MNEYDNKDRNPAEFSPSDWAGYWTKEISASKRWLKKWHTQGQKIEREYLSQSQSGTMTEDDTAHYNLFWANIDIILSAAYAKLPEPEVDRTHLDPADDISRVAGLILERIFQFELKNVENSPDEVYRQAIKDRYIAGMGTAWPRYDYQEQQLTTPPIMAEDGVTELAPQVTQILITNEQAPLDYVRWDDLFFSPTRNWETIRWQARRMYMTKPALVKRFGEIIANQVQMKTGIPSLMPDDPLRLSPEPVGEVFEIWSKDHMTAFWYSQGATVILDMKQDPLKLTGFFPAKRPLIATHVSSAFIPRPDYVMVQDQYQELNLLAGRMRLLTEALRVVGVYDKTAESLQRLLSQAAMNQMIPVDNWAMFAEKGGIKGQIDWFPLEIVVNTLEKMTARKQALVTEVYEILGLSDIMRGMSVASETATAQQLKAQYGSARVQSAQNYIARFVTMNTRVRGEIICKHWQPQTIIERSQIMLTPDAQFAQQAVQMLKQDPSMAYRLTITADTLSAPDWNQEKQQRTEFLQAISQFIGMSMPLVQMNPGAGVYLMQVLQWAATGFKAGKQIEGVFDQAMQALQKDLATPKPPKPPTAQEEKDRSAAAKNEAEAKQKNLESMYGLYSMGAPPGMLRAVPPTARPGQMPAPPGVQQPPGQGGPGRPPETALPPHP